MSEAVAPSGRRLLVACAAAALTLSWLLPLHVTWSSAPDLGHAWVVPVLMAYLYWERWDERPALSTRGHLPSSWWILVIVLGLLHLSLRLFLIPFPLWPAVVLIYTALLVAALLAGAWLLAGNPGIRWVSGPLILLASTLPLPSVIESRIILPLREIWASLAVEISNALGHPAIAMGTSVRIGNSWLGVEDACGGIRSLQACAMIGLFFGEWFRFKFHHRAVLLLAGISAALLGNFGRILFLSLRARGGTAAVNETHDPAGWISMTASLVITGFFACRWNNFRWPETPSHDLKPLTAPRRTVAYLWITTLAAILCFNEIASRAWFFCGPRTGPSAPRWIAVYPEEDRSFRSVQLGRAARELLRPDVFCGGKWRDEGGITVASHYVEWQKGQAARSLPFLHNPTICLPVSGCELIAELDPIVLRWAHGDIPFYTYKFHQLGSDILVAFTIWDPSQGKLLNPPQIASWRDWFVIQWNHVREARQHQPCQLLAVTIPWTETGSTDMENILGRLVRPRVPIQKI